MKQLSNIQKGLCAVILLLFFFSVEIGAQTPAPPTGGTWKKVEELSDEFDSFDNSKWYKELWNYGLPNLMVAENAGVAEGKLWIKATLGTGDRWFNSCRVQSRTAISYPMYAECSMKASSISALNTFWMNNGNSENRNEIDICENNAAPTGSPVHGKETPYINASNIWHVTNGVNRTDESHNSTKDLSDDNPYKGLKMDEAYHTIGLYWVDATTFKWYLNGEHVGTSVSPYDFTRNLAIIWDLWTNSWDGYATKASLQIDSINTMYVDWIHTYKLTGAIDPGNEFGNEFSLGNPTIEAYADGWSHNMLINKTDVYTNTSGGPEEIIIGNFNFYARQLADPVTPFVVKVNGSNDFTVLAIGTTRTKDEYEVGENSFAFNDGPKTVLSLADGETIATGFLDSYADGSGGGNGSVIPYDLGLPLDNLWYTGTEELVPFSGIEQGAAPTNYGEILALERNYSYNIEFAIDGATNIKELGNEFRHEVYPNPAENFVNIKVARSGDIEILLRIYDIMGIEVFKEIVRAGKVYRLDVSPFQSGLYIVKVGNTSIPLMVE